MALAIAICTHCEGCIAYHVHDALDAGATHDQVTETIGVAVMMGGGPAADLRRPRARSAAPIRSRPGRVTEPRSRNCVTTAPERR